MLKTNVIHVKLRESKVGGRVWLFLNRMSDNEKQLPRENSLLTSNFV